MSSHLMIGMRELDTKFTSRLVYDYICELERGIRADRRSTAKQQKYFVPEYYELVDGIKLGRGGWAIRKKGLALLAQKTESSLYDNSAIEAFVLDEYECAFKGVSEEEAKGKMLEFSRYVRIEISEAYTTILSALADMVLSGEKEVYTSWI